ncbi:2-succinyl-5-enolpyruvyl-6-hydroxy-3-cyclohexene-1-carboxylic-acid synthase [Rhodohalobacter halophilus]|uniref:2-succinyl-5-enolpyruvyl-6-hydroxy-3- cyclohexene-1-carboxylic-acid synthase n=1 Tax=Rhodohalobacter halophilus TaxID=1812810 RepID=UPI00083FCDEB|nr:2-succinyl-5-enolpyruvyl-6-hydroxy-3-cyclohexene-1-carboxylic-acid synthase [Rhodohalobacter halophilus]
MNSHLRWTSEFIHSLYQSGVRHAVISPGSRSTPLTFAAAIHDGIEQQIVLDERSAAFIALGIGKSTGTPAVLICTSGTAAVNYMPAITEAKESGVPLIVLTADRPPNLRGIGSSQTVDQIKLYGNQTVFFHEAGEPRFEVPDLRRLRYLAKQAVSHATEQGGAVHINFPFRKPLEPTVDEIETEKTRLDKHLSSKTDLQFQKAQRTVYPGDSLKTLLSESVRPLIIAGPADPAYRLSQQLSEVAQLTNAPVIAEPGSGVNAGNQQIHRYEQFLRSSEIRNDLKPDIILRFSDQPYTKSVLTALEEWNEIPTFHFTARNSDQDHTLSVTDKIILSPVDRLHFESTELNPEKNWLNLWKSYDQKSQKELEKSIKAEGKLTDGHLFQKIDRSLPKAWNIMLSNSFIPRDMAMFGSSGEFQFVNRGAAGIDGIISTAIGISASTEKPTCCITGDLAFLHDSNALLSIRQASEPFLLVVVNNGGGNIFNMLPVSDNREYFEECFLTPQAVDLEHLANAYGIPYSLIDSVHQLDRFTPIRVTKHKIVEVRTDSKASMRMRKTLWGV